MSNSFSLGKKEEGWGHIDFDKLKSGITKSDLGIDDGSVLASIFDSIDTDKNGDSNGKLDRQELNAFMEKVRLLCGKDNNLSEKEASEFELSDGSKVGKKNKKEVLLFLAKLSVLTSGIEKVIVDGASELVEYANGIKEETFTNGAKIVSEKRGSMDVVTTYINNKKAQEVIKERDGRTTTITYEDDGETPKEKETVYLLTDYAEANGAKYNCIKKEKYDAQTCMYNFVSEVRECIDADEVKIIETVDDLHTTQSVYTNGEMTSMSYVRLGENAKTTEYDQNGNTYIIVQPDERNPETLAKKFGCSKEEIIELNDNRVYFNVGEKVKIPQHLEPNDEILQNRLSSDEAVSVYEEQKKE